MLPAVSDASQVCSFDRVNYASLMRCRLGWLADCGSDVFTVTSNGVSFVGLARTTLYTVYIRCFGQGIHQIFGHIRCINLWFGSKKYLLLQGQQVYS
jgi:hypothetical protein